MEVERASLFLVDHVQGVLRLSVSQDRPGDDGEIRIPIGSGIVGAAAATGETLRVDDAYSDPRFNPDVDRETGFRTRSILAMPVRDRNGRVFAVAQPLNRRDDSPFEAADEERVRQFVEPLGVVFETWQRMTALSAARSA
jgi:adenylate cyclase